MTKQQEDKKRKPILIIDDDKAQLETLADIFELDELYPICCNSGKEAIEACKQHEVNVVVLDLQLPDIDGFELMRKLKQNNPDIKIIINTGYPSLNTAMTAVNEEVYAYVKKMGDVKELLAHIHRAFHAHFSLYSKKLEQDVSLRTTELLKANEELKKEIAERERAEQIQSVLYSISQAINISDNLKSILAIIDLQLGTLIDTSNFHIALYDEETDSYSYPYFVERNKNEQNLISTKFYRSLTDYVMKTRQPLKTDENEIKQLINQNKIEFSENPCKNWIGAPLTSIKRVIGVVVVFNFEAEEIYSVKDLELLTIIAENIALAVERKQAEIKLKENEFKFSTAFHANASPMAISTIKEGRFIDVNNAFLDIFKFERSEVIGKTSAELNIFLDYSVRSKIVESIQQKKNFRNVEVLVRTKNAKVRTGMFSGDIIRLQGQEYLLIVMHDITERKQSERALRESEKKLADAQRISHTGNWEWDVKKNQIHWSNELYRIYGLDPDNCEVTFEHAWNPIHEADKETVGKTIETSQKTGDPYEIEYRINLATGEQRYIHSMANTEVDDNGKVIQIYGTAQDITERKKAEITIKKNEEKYRTLVETMNDGLVIRDENGILTYVNDKMCKMLDYTQDEIVGHLLTNFLDKNNQKILAEQILKRKSGSRDAYELEWLAINGRKVPTIVSPAPIFDSQGNLKGSFAVITDITKRKKAEKKLKENEERFRLYFTNINDIIFSVNVKNILLSISPSVERILGYKPYELVGKTFKELNLLSPNSIKTSLSDAEKIFLGKSIEMSEYEFIAKDGSRRFCEVSGSPMVRDNEIVATVSVARDITERQKMEEELQKACKLESIGILAGGIAHDFNNLLTSILGNISLAKVDVNSDDEIYETLSDSEKAALRAQDLTQQLLTFSKGGTPIKKLSSITNLIKDAIRFGLRGSNVKCEYVISKDIWPVEIDEGQMNQVMNNLIINAVQAMPKGGIITIAAKNMKYDHSENSIPLEEGDYIMISIKDQGVGINEEHLANIFDPYFTTKQKGSGLGLATAYSIIKNHGGYITVNSEVGKGANFYIYIPASPQQLSVAETVIPEPVLGKGKILIMDDDEAIRQLAGKILNRAGYDVEFAIDGQKTVELYQKTFNSDKPFDVVIIDLTIPGGMGGKETIQKLIEIDPDVKAIVSSGYSNDTIMANYSEYGFRGFITKPYKLVELSRVVHDVMENIFGIRELFDS